ncbi:hypothetical protein BGZ73_000113 [Actinomortierella ambigua]|nr:hypothetical protein BGZ73_000113 [Actinomortierella ambigua]
MSVPFEDPLLHPPTPPVPPPKQQPVSTQDDDEDRPIPFQDNASSTTVATPFFLPQQRQADPPPPPPPRASESASTPRASTDSSPNVVQDPLGAFSSSPPSHTPSPAPDGRATVNRRSIQRPVSQQLPPPLAAHSVTTSSMPTEMPTQLASPPLPQRPAVAGSSGFSAFQAFASPLQPPTSSNTPIPGLAEGERSDRVEDDKNGKAASAAQLQQQQQQNQQSQEALSSGLVLDLPHGSTASTTRSSLGIHIPMNAGITGGSLLDEGADLVQQDLKSPPPQQQQSMASYAQQQQPYLPSSGMQSPPSDRTVFGGPHHVTTPTGALLGTPVTPTSTSFRPERLPVLNSPNMFHDIHLTNPMNEILSKHVPPDRFVPRDWNAFTEAEQRLASQSEILQELTINNSWMAMARFAKSQILGTPADQILKLINLWYARLMALVQLGEYEMARAEFEQLGDLRGPLYRYEHYPPEMLYEPTETERLASLMQDAQLPVQRKGCMVPFEMLVLQARLPGYMGDAAEAIDQLYDLILYCKKDYPLASRHAHDLARQYFGDINLHSGLGRLYLQLGDLEQAAKVFENVEAMVNALSGSPSHAHFSLQVLMNKAFLAVSQGHWVAAKHAFEQVLLVEPENLAVSNNLAVCELYMGMLNEAIPRLQGLMFAYPTSAGISELLVFNLATLYELRSDGSFNQKQQLMLEVSKWAGDQFNTSMFKL